MDETIEGSIMPIVQLDRLSMLQHHKERQCSEKKGTVQNKKAACLSLRSHAAQRPAAQQ